MQPPEPANYWYVYSRWDERQPVALPPAELVLAAIADDLFDHGDLDRALARLVRWGADQPFELTGLQQLLAQALVERRQWLDRLRTALTTAGDQQPGLATLQALLRQADSTGADPAPALERRLLAAAPPDWLADTTPAASAAGLARAALQRLQALATVIEQLQAAHAAGSAEALVSAQVTALLGPAAGAAVLQLQQLPAALIGAGLLHATATGPMLTPLAAARQRWRAERRAPSLSVW
jgi:hypothetical protein